MARLPDLRGVDVLEWSLLLGVQPGVSVHWVDSGVDTGQVLAFEALLPAASDTLESMRERAVVASARLLADRIQHLEPGTAPVTASSQPQFFALHPRLRAVAQARLTHCTVES
jgi:methionyl-tRNA formyltransferase